LRFQVPVDPTRCASVSGSGRHLEDHDQQRHDDDDIQEAPARFSAPFLTTSVAAAAVPVSRSEYCATNTVVAQTFSSTHLHLDK
jgi:hypothetical protein